MGESNDTRFQNVDGVMIELTADQLAAEIAYVPPSSQPAVGDYEDAIQTHIDRTARERRFRDGVTMASYSASTNPQWAVEAQTFIEWRDAVWIYCYAEFAKVQAGQRPQPTLAVFLTELPAIIWPA